MQTIQIDHPDAKRIRSFLSNIKEPITPLDFDWHTWSLSDKMKGGWQFAVKAAKPAMLTFLLCDSYQDANKIGEANKLNSTPNGRWNVNGNILYLVESEDKEIKDELLGLFAGKEKESI